MPDSPFQTAIDEALIRERLAQAEQIREFCIQMWLQNPALARRGGTRVRELLAPLQAAEPNRKRP